VAAITAEALGLPSLSVVWCEPAFSFEAASDLHLRRLARALGQPCPNPVLDPFDAEQDGRALRGLASRDLAIAEAPAVYIVVAPYSWDLVETIGHEGMHVRQYRDGLLGEHATPAVIDLAEDFADRAGRAIGNLWRDLLTTSAEHRRLEVAYCEQSSAWLKTRRDRGVPCQ
jgi:hypothetical protein